MELATSNHTMSDVPLLNTTVMSHNDGQRIALLTNFQCLALPKDPQSFGILIKVLQAYVVNM